jgi:hypothetical protein
MIEIPPSKNDYFSFGFSDLSHLGRRPHGSRPVKAKTFKVSLHPLVVIWISGEIIHESVLNKFSTLGFG